MGLHPDHGRLTVRRDYLALWWPPRSADAAERATRLRQTMSDAPAWRPALEREGLVLWRRGPEDLPLRETRDGTVIIGEFFERDPWASDGREDIEAQARALSRHGWGQFVALLPHRSGERWIYRDPSGLVDALTWRLEGGVHAVGSALDDLPPGAVPPRLAVDWDRVRSFVGVPTVATTAALFRDVRAVGPGGLLPAHPEAPERLVWSPTAFAAPADAAPEALAAEMVRRIDACTDALVQPHARVLMELSGGLDSSTLAGALAFTGRLGHVAQWLNVADPRPEADERAYAQAVADRLDVPLTVVERRPQPLTEADLADLGDLTWPSIAGVDATRDRDERDRVRRLGATAILSGQGGDAVFFQMASALVAADALRSRGLALLADPLLAQVARRIRSSVWTVLREARQALRDGASGPKHINALLTAAARDAVADEEHAWVRAAQASDLPPGKRFHIRALATNHFNHACSRRRQVADLLFPLLAQPVVELALSIPTQVLAGGAHARPFQRAAFVDRLPPLVRQRRAKGFVSVYLAQTMALSLDRLRPFLLDGRLCDAGLLDRQRLDRVLSRDFLLQTAGGNDLVGAIATEAWVRRWDG